MEEPAKVLQNFIWFASVDFNIQPGLHSKMVFGHFQMMFPNREYKDSAGTVLAGCFSHWEPARCPLPYFFSPSSGRAWALEFICLGSNPDITTIALYSFGQLACEASVSSF